MLSIGLSVGTLRGLNYGHSISFSNMITKHIYSDRITSIYYKWFLMVEYWTMIHVQILYGVTVNNVFTCCKLIVH